MRCRAHTPECLVTKKRDDNSGAPLRQTYGGRACTPMMYHRTDSLFVKQPVVRDVPEHEYMRGNIDAPEPALAHNKYPMVQLKYIHLPSPLKQAPSRLLSPWLQK